jgi:hypothetical protein
VLGLVAFMVTDVLLYLAAMLALVSFLDDVRMSAFIDILWGFVMVEVAFYLATLLVLCTRMLVVYTMFNMTVVMSFVTLHGSLL